MFMFVFILYLWYSDELKQKMTSVQNYATLKLHLSFPAYSFGISLLRLYDPQPVNATSLWIMCVCVGGGGGGCLCGGGGCTGGLLKICLRIEKTILKKGSHVPSNELFYITTTTTTTAATTTIATFTAAAVATTIYYYCCCCCCCNYYY